MMSIKRWRPRVAAAALSAVAAGVLSTTAAAAPPANTAPPSISGTPTVGQTLTASDGTWSNNPTSFAYQWLRCNGGGNSCANVANGTQKTYTLVGADAGHTMRVRVTATNADGSNSAQSAQTAPVAAATPAAAPKNTAPTHDLRDSKSRATTHSRPGLVERQPDLVRLSVAALRRRRRHLLEHRRCDQPNLRRPERRPGLPAAGDGDSPKREGLRDDSFGTHGDRGAGRDDHEPPSERDDPPSPVHRADGLRDLPDLRRLVQEPHHQGDRLPARQALLHAPLRNARATETMRRLLTALASGCPLPRPRPLHADAARNRQIRPHEPAHATHFLARVNDRPTGVAAERRDSLPAHPGSRSTLDCFVALTRRCALPSARRGRM